MKEEFQSNYEKLCEDWRLKFMEMDRELLMKKLPEIKIEKDEMTIRHFGRKYGVSLTDGWIRPLEDEGPVRNLTKLNIYNLFWYVKEHATYMDRWVPFRDVRNAGPFAPAFQRNILEPLALTFSGKTEELKKACRLLGGVPVKQGDSGYILKAFDCIPMEFLFWDKDEEFEAQANILYDYSVTDFIHVESTVTLAEEGVIRLAELAGVPIRGNIFVL